jgi:hypothetical protein
MEHLTLEELARLVDEAPTPPEARHVRDCIACRRELDALRSQTRLLGSLDDPALPAGAWPALETELRAEGLLTHVSLRAPGRRMDAPWLRIAAGAALFLVGGASGAAIWSRVSRPQAAAVAPLVAEGPAVSARHVAAAPARVAPVISTAQAEPAADPAPAEETREAGTGAGVRLASSTEPALPQRAPQQGSASAQRELAEAEAAYVAALQRYAAIADPSSGADPATRMAALDRMISTTRAALDRAPDDPVINGYHMAAVREREALRRQLAGADKDWF